MVSTLNANRFLGKMLGFIRSLSVRGSRSDTRERERDRTLSSAKRQKLWQRLSVWLLPAEPNNGQPPQRPTAPAPGPGVGNRNRDGDGDCMGNHDRDGDGDLDGEWSDCDDDIYRDSNRGCLFCERKLRHDEHLPIITREHSIRRSNNYYNRVQLHYSDSCFLCVNRLGNHDQHVTLQQQHPQQHPQQHFVNDDRGID